MTSEQLIARLRSIVSERMPLPGAGETARRHMRLMEVGRENLSLARLAEAHWDALAIIAEAGQEPEPGSLYGVWASEIPGQALRLDSGKSGLRVSGTKMFCSGAGLIDRALVTVGVPGQLLIDLDVRTNDLRMNACAVKFDDSSWKTSAFRETATATATFCAIPVSREQVIGEPGWYLDRSGFWHGACGPAACWAGGAAGLVDYALQQSREDPHTMAHLGAMQAAVWALRAYLEAAGHEIDDKTERKIADIRTAARIRARTVRHLVEQACTEVLRRLTRAYGPHPLAMNQDISRRYQELDLYLRQSHAERDLEELGRDVKQEPHLGI